MRNFREVRPVTAWYNSPSGYQPDLPDRTPLRAPQLDRTSAWQQAYRGVAAIYHPPRDYLEDDLIYDSDYMTPSFSTPSDPVSSSDRSPIAF